MPKVSSDKQVCTRCTILMGLTLGTHADDACPLLLLLRTGVGSQELIILHLHSERASALCVVRKGRTGENSNS